MHFKLVYVFAFFFLVGSFASAGYDPVQCTDRSPICTMQYDPVCGTKLDCGNQTWCEENNMPCGVCSEDRKTYGNSCMACADGVDYWNSGECEKTVVCPIYSAPICSAGMVVGASQDENGCSVPICVNETGCTKNSDCPGVACYGVDLLLQGKCVNGQCVVNGNCNQTLSCPESSEIQCNSNQVKTSERDSNGCLVFICVNRAFNLSNGRKAEIKIMPETAFERAIERLGELNFTIELKEVGKGNESRAVYELKTEREGKIFGLFRAKGKVTALVNAETGDVEKVNKPWWAFLASGI